MKEIIELELSSKVSVSKSSSRHCDSDDLIFGQVIEEPILDDRTFLIIYRRVKNLHAQVVNQFLPSGVLFDIKSRRLTSTNDVRPVLLKYLGTIPKTWNRVELDIPTMIAEVKIIMIIIIEITVSFMLLTPRLKVPNKISTFELSSQVLGRLIIFSTL